MITEKEIIEILDKNTEEITYMPKVIEPWNNNKFYQGRIGKVLKVNNEIIAKEIIDYLEVYK